MLQSPFKIIIVDDDIDDHYLFKDALMQLNIPFEITPFYNGLELLDHLKKIKQNILQHVNVIIMDINMPTMDGILTLTHLKQDTGLKKIPVFMLSTTHEASDNKKCLELGALKLFTKPNNAREFNKILKEIFSDTRVKSSKD